MKVGRKRDGGRSRIRSELLEMKVGFQKAAGGSGRELI